MTLKDSANKSTPKGLSTEAKGIWNKIVEGWELDEAGKIVLLVALEQFDRYRKAQKRVNQDGETIVDRWGQIKPHPSITAERDSYRGFLAGMKQLNLDLEPLRDTIGRPPGR